MASHVLSKELQLYYERVTSYITGTDERLQDAALKSVASDPGELSFNPYPDRIPNLSPSLSPALALPLALTVALPPCRPARAAALLHAVPGGRGDHQLEELARADEPDALPARAAAQPAPQHRALPASAHAHGAHVHGGETVKQVAV